MSVINMEALLNYVTTVEEMENDLVKSTKQFEERIKLTWRNEQIRRKNTVKATIMLVNSQIPREEQSLCHVKSWWEHFVQEQYPEEQCLEYLRCSRKTYVYLIKILRPYICPKWRIVKNISTSKAQKGVTTAKQVAIMLFKLGCRGDFSAISRMFGIHKSTVHKVLYKVICNICRHLLPSIVKIPDATEAAEIANWFEEHTKIPQVIGVMDKTHIPIGHCARMGGNLFINSKNYYSFIIQTIIDSNGCFRDVSVRHPGSVNDVRVLEDSNIYKLGKNVLPQNTKNILGRDIRFQVIGPTSYPLLPWLLTEYTMPTTQDELLFNHQLEETRNLGAKAINRMRARFSILSHPMDISFKITPQLVAACCVLHNICERNDDQFLENWLSESTTLLEKYPQPEKIPKEATTTEITVLQQRDSIRNFLEIVGLLTKDIQ